jgi:hypothetical protein
MNFEELGSKSSSYVDFMQINSNMLEILVIQKPDNHIEFEWKFKFLMKIYESFHID